MGFPDHYIKIDNVLTGFQEYLAASSRAILSAKFGDGKSVFLNEFRSRNNEGSIYSWQLSLNKSCQL
ncbi:MAG: hypothetical protein ACRDCN_06120 [Tannerellaceae bacterium]